MLISFQCQTYMRLARETVAQDEVDGGDADLEVVMAQSDDNDDKIYSAMGCAKTIGAVSQSHPRTKPILNLDSSGHFVDRYFT